MRLVAWEEGDGAGHCHGRVAGCCRRVEGVSRAKRQSQTLFIASVSRACRMLSPTSSQVSLMSRGKLGVDPTATAGLQAKGSRISYISSSSTGGPTAPAAPPAAPPGSPAAAPAAPRRRLRSPSHFRRSPYVVLGTHRSRDLIFLFTALGIFKIMWYPLIIPKHMVLGTQARF